MGRIIPLHRLTIFSIANPPNISFNFDEGAAFLVNKPNGWSSYKAVTHLRKCIDLRKVGHAGTLDPMATGALILCCGKATRTIRQIQKLPKTYKAEVTFGTSTLSYDAETETANRLPFDHITPEKIKNKLDKHFSGKIMQTPPMYSALKHNGKPLYKFARKGEEVERKAREITIYSSRLKEYDSPKAELIIRCSKGTYIRSIAHELGLKLNSAAHLSGLERTAIGSFKNEDALTIDDLNLIFGLKMMD
ncbi:MAG TPA: tRNA pseudouridine(55) synthase TruB [Balneolaceae bacterium]|nr:tRNA pseudouridine(55) synthase TruB [Balneolaceae bacterium]